MNQSEYPIKFGEMSLIVSDLDRMVAIYRNVLGFGINSLNRHVGSHGADGKDLLLLQEHPEAKRQSGAARLYHFAVLFPTRKDLAIALTAILGQGIVMDGYADHDVSGAVIKNIASIMRIVCIKSSPI